MDWYAIILLYLFILGTADTANNEDDVIVEKMTSINVNDNKKNGGSALCTAEFNEQFDKNAVSGPVLHEAPSEELKGAHYGNFTTAPNSSTALNTTAALVNCSLGKVGTDLPVEIVNGSRLIGLLKSELNTSKRLEAGDCVAVIFYAPYCPFCCTAAPHFNALPRAFPDIRIVALNAMKFHSFNTQYGVLGVPSLILFHNGRPVAKFNNSQYNLETFSKFLTKYTGFEPKGKLLLTSEDFAGPLPNTPVKQTNYCLLAAWIFILVYAVHCVTKSVWWRWVAETIQNTWREAEAQHEHKQ